MTSKNDETHETLAGCGYAIILILIAPVSMIWRGYVLSLLWRWFIASQFGVVALNIPQAIGISCVVGFLTQHARHEPKDERTAHEKFVFTLMASLLWPALALGMGAAVTRWL